MILIAGWTRLMAIAVALIRCGAVHGSTLHAMSAARTRQFTRKILSNAQSVANPCANHVLRVNLSSARHAMVTSAQTARNPMNAKKQKQNPRKNA